jgi:hypothetical protein
MENNLKLIAIEVDASTGTQSTRALTSEEIFDRELVANQNALLQEQTVAKAEARTSALAKLAALGLTEEEIAAL